MLFSEDDQQRALPTNRASSYVTAFQYRPLVQESIPEDLPTVEVQEPKVCLSEEGFAQRLAKEYALGVAEAETRLKRDLEQALATERARVAESIRLFEHTRTEYFAKVESEVVQLALSIARKILHREAQVDPLLVSALVQVALTQIKKGSAVTVRVRPEEVALWCEQLRPPAVDAEVMVIGDSDRLYGDCVLETELGSVNFNLEAQLKEVEQGFLDVLARTPQV